MVELSSPFASPDQAAKEVFLGSSKKLASRRHEVVISTVMSGNEHIGYSSASGLNREAILRALGSLSEQLGQKDVTGEICLFGGTAMVLAFSARISTKDVDGIFQPAQLIRDLARQIAVEQGLPDNWLNDGVKGFVSTRHETAVNNFPQFPHLRLTMPVAEYLLAMKCMASRIGGTQGEQSDVPDIVFLIRHLGIKSAKAVMDLVAQYYPDNRIPVKAQYLIEGLFEERQL